MGSWGPVGNYVTPQAISDTSTTQKLDLGTTIRCKYRKAATSDTALGEAEFIYLKGAASTVVSDYVKFDEAFATTRVTANAVGPGGWAMSANVANQYGWYQRKGICIANVAASFAADKAVFLTSTASVVDDAPVKGDLIANCVSLSAIDTPITGDAYIWADYPYTDDYAET